MPLKVEWLDHGRTATQPPNPHYPDGMDIDVSDHAWKFCSRVLPYPAPRCGIWLISCDRCSITVAISAAGRIDDPRSVKVACKKGNKS
jgi:hypothetical protein